MKKLLLIIALIIPSPAIFAQQFYGGIKGGLTFSQIDNDGFGGPNKIGLTVAALTGKKISPDLSWQFEIKYVQRGMADPPTFAGDDYSYYTYHYIEFPISYNYRIKEKYMPEAGLSPDIFIRLNAIENGDPVPVPEIEEIHRIGLNVFGGFYYWFSDHTSVGLRFTYSAISFMTRDKTQLFPYNLGFFHNVISLNLNYRFPIR